MQQVCFILSYAHEYLLPGELSKQQVLVKSKILTPYQMVQIDKGAEIQKSKAKKSEVAIEWRNLIRIEDEEEESSSISMSMYNLDSDREGSDVPSHISPTIIIHDAPLPMPLEKIHSSPITEKIPCEMHSVIQEDHPSSYNIE